MLPFLHVAILGHVRIPAPAYPEAPLGLLSSLHPKVCKEEEASSSSNNRGRGGDVVRDGTILSMTSSVGVGAPMLVTRGEVEGGIVDDGSRGGDVVRDGTILSMGSIVGMAAAGVSIRPDPPDDSSSPFVCPGSFGGGSRLPRRRGEWRPTFRAAEGWGTGTTSYEC